MTRKFLRMLLDLFKEPSPSGSFYSIDPHLDPLHY